MNRVLEAILSFKGLNMKAFLQVCVIIILVGWCSTEARESAGITSSGSEAKRHGIDYTNIAIGSIIEAARRKLSS